MKRFFKRFMRKGEIGQSIVILALGFIGLVAFVGITTDVSLLFARYAQLTRAVDAASIAAAGQMRRDRSFATVGLSARQFIEFHGLSPRRVIVETCESPPIEDADPTTPGIELPDGTDLWDVAPEICTEEQLKLVRVTAQIDSPTVFLSLLGFGSITLQASAISETAVLDVVIVMDVSESMLSETTYADWTMANQGYAYLPPFLDLNQFGSGWPTDTSGISDHPDADLRTVLRRMAEDGMFQTYDSDSIIEVPAEFVAGPHNQNFVNFNPNTVYPTVGPGDPPPDRIPDITENIALIDDDGRAGITIERPRTWYDDWFWQSHLLGVPQEAVNNRVWYTDTGDVPIGGEPDAARVAANEAMLLGTRTDLTAPNSWGMRDPSLLCFLGASDCPGDPAMSWYQSIQFIPSDVQELIDDGEFDAADLNPSRDACRVRFFPYSTTLAIPDYLLDIYDTARAEEGTRPDGSYVIDYQTSADGGGRWGGFVPTYNFYGCCNDPGNGEVNLDGEIFDVTSSDGDGLFSDLVCQPFKQAKDAVRLFLERIDFERGDRVGFVTFDRTAFLLDFDEGTWDPTAGEIVPGTETNVSHMIETRADARDFLNWYVGVRAEPNFYQWNPDGGGWYWDEDGDGFPETQFASGVEDGRSIGVEYDTVLPTEPGGNLYPVASSCLYQNATLEYPYTLYATRNAAAAGLPTGTYENAPALRNIMYPDVYSDDFGDWDERFNTGVDGVTAARSAPGAKWGEGVTSYQLWAQCRGTNIGAALREGSAAFSADASFTRSEGSVWVMILLSDGAAGASDPARSNARTPFAPEPYEVTSADPAAELPYEWWVTLDADTTNDAFTQFGLPGGYDITGDGEPELDRPPYGVYGVCPPGQPTTDPQDYGELMRVSSPTGEPRFPFCSDEEVRTRHTCTATIRARLDGEPGSVGIGRADIDGETLTEGFAPNSLSLRYDDTLTFAENLDLGNVYDIDTGVYGADDGCDELYDVDDYARDWADFITGLQYVGAPASEAAPDNLQLPTIFTIGFGLNFENGAGTCEDNIEDCLGEELLRYIADVGDNFRVDTDYQQDYRDDGLLNNSAWDEYGAPDPCEPDGGGYDRDDPDPPTSDSDIIGMDEVGDGRIIFRTGGESCGNYFNAPGRAELELVFNEIASRMFTRLSR